MMSGVEKYRGRGLRWSALLVFCTGLIGTAVAQPVPSHISRYDVRVWQTDEGLPQNTVNAIAQTLDGYLWVGTREGLARFDGVRFTAWDVGAAAYLRNTNITALCVSRDGSLWIASESNGLTRLKDGDISHYLKADGLPDNQIQCLLESRDGGLWIGGETGLARFKEGRFKTFTESEMVHNNSIKALHEDDQGILRAATVTGLVSVNGEGVVSTNNFGIGLVTNVLKAVCVDRLGRLWLGALDGLICLTDGKRGSYAANKSDPEKITTVIHEDEAGQLWVGTYAGLTRRVNANLLPWWLGKTGVEDVVNTIFEDREQSLWVGGRDGLYRLSPPRFVSLTMQDGLAGNNVVSVLEDRAGAMWFGLWGNGLTRLQGGEFTAITKTNGLTYDNVLSLRESRDGNLWVGMDFVGGVNRLGSTRSNNFPRTPGLFAAPIRVIYEDATSAVWIGTGKGLNVIRSNQVVSYTTTNGLAGNNVTVICEDQQKNLWIGTDGGLSRWTGDGFVNLTTKDGLSQNYINALYEDAAQELWIGTKGGGLNRLKAGRLTSYTTKQGLFNDEVYEILEDDSGHLWMSCRRGIFRVSRSQFDEFDQGKIARINCTTFGREDGLATVQCNGVAKPAGWKSRDGRLWFATVRGVVAVESRIKINEQPPMVAIEEIIVDGRGAPLGGLVKFGAGPIKIPPGSGRVEIFYTALSLQSAEKNRFKYRLQGVDEDWVDAGHQRAVTYNNVPPGRRYRFQVIACNNDGVWNNLGAELSFYVEPHFWQTWWFKAALVSLPIVLVALFYRVRVARLRELENLRIRIAADLHDDVGSRLTKVAMVTELADRDTPGGAPGKPHIQNITRTVRDITRAMDEIVWTINPRNDTLENLANYIFHYAQEYFQDTGVRCRLDLPPNLPDQRISTEERHHLFMVVKEALNNILKHAAATEVRIALALTDDDMTIEIMDNGRGIVAGRPDPTGEGMTNMKERLAKIGGEFKLRSKSDGTTITLRLRR
jgi:ligand-binding sensor domain-containing protein